MPREAGGNTIPEVTRLEHDDTGGVPTKKVLVYGWDSGSLSKKRLSVDASGNLSISSGGIYIPDSDYISYTSNATSDVYVYKTGGSGGTTVATITINYTDSTKETISYIAKT